MKKQSQDSAKYGIIKRVIKEFFMNSLLTAPLCRMKDIILRPHLSVGLSWQDQKSGKAGNDKSLYLSRAMTASDFLLVLLVIRACFCLQLHGKAYILQNIILRKQIELLENEAYIELIFSLFFL